MNDDIAWATRLLGAFHEHCLGDLLRWWNHQFVLSKLRLNLFKERPVVVTRQPHKRCTEIRKTRLLTLGCRISERVACKNESAHVAKNRLRKKTGDGQFGQAAGEPVLRKVGWKASSHDIKERRRETWQFFTAQQINDGRIIVHVKSCSKLSDTRIDC